MLGLVTTGFNRIRRFTHTRSDIEELLVFLQGVMFIAGMFNVEVVETFVRGFNKPRDAMQLYHTT